MADVDTARSSAEEIGRPPSDSDDGWKVDRVALARRRRRIAGAVGVGVLVVVGLFLLFPRSSPSTDELRFEVSGMRVQRIGGPGGGVDMSGPPGYEVEYLPGGEMLVDITLYAHRPTRITGFEYVPPDLDFPALFEQVDVQIAAGDATTGADLVFEPLKPFSLRAEETITIQTRLRFANCEDRSAGMGVGTNPVVVVDGVGRQILNLPSPVAVVGPPDELCPGRT